VNGSPLFFFFFGSFSQKGIPPKSYRNGNTKLRSVNLSGVILPNYLGRQQLLYIDIGTYLYQDATDPLDFCSSRGIWNNKVTYSFAQEQQKADIGFNQIHPY